ncbi:heparinase II/III family protein [Paucibacter sp. B51]|uniref:heparinase II/III family protein n=1 Tax=Paucibacter sp. B51 TaxID=2993315 RepID=UPI0022EBEB2E|nr:alginate lyase family protein [Paucibacter sp. B51]
MSLKSERLVWLVRRLSRMYWQEVPFRAQTVLRSLAQGQGLFTAKRVPARAADASFGQAWLRVPEPGARQEALILAAERLLAGEYSVFGQPVAFEQGLPDWNRDPVTGTLIPSTFGLGIDFRHVGAGIDIKHLWELNRHVWWVTLAQAWALTADPRYLQRIAQLLRSWLRSCPYAMGPNWSSPVEHGIRLINWSLVWHLIGAEKSPIFQGPEGQGLLRDWLDSIYQHMRFASDNYSFYSSADNHLIGEAAGVYVAAQTWDLWPQGRRLCARAKRLLEEETLKQFAPDGVNREQALCYHKFTLQFLLASALAGRARGDTFSAAFWQRVESAVIFLAAVTDCAGNTPAYGDSDDGEVWTLGAGVEFDSYHAMVAMGSLLFERAELLAKTERLPEAGRMEQPWLALHRGVRRAAAPVPAAQALPDYFPDGGYALLGHRLHADDELRLLFDCGPLGYNRISGHGHADVLALQLSRAGDPLLVDAGTYCYNAAPRLRHFFRGTHAHNTLVVEDLDQSIYGASFLWLRDIVCTVTRRERSGRAALMQAHHDGYLRLPDPVRHHRRVQLGEGDAFQVDDWLECRQAHQVTLHWHAAAGARLSERSPGEYLLSTAAHRVLIRLKGPITKVAIVEGQEAPPQGWVSPGFYRRHAAPVLVVSASLQPNETLSSSFEIFAEAAVAEAGRTS